MKRIAQMIRTERHMVALNFILMMLHCVLLLFGINIHAEIVEVCIGFYVIHRFSISLGFCTLTRLMIYHSYIVTLCIWFERYIGFGMTLTIARCTVIALGILITTAILRHENKRQAE